MPDPERLRRGEQARSSAEAILALRIDHRELIDVTIYANVVNVRSAGKDIVLEFGSFFPTADQRFPPKDHQPELRVVMSSDLIEPLVEILRERLRPASPSGTAQTSVPQG